MSQSTERSEVSILGIVVIAIVIAFVSQLRRSSSPTTATQASPQPTQGEEPHIHHPPGTPTLGN